MLFATSNKNKIKEFQDILGIEIESIGLDLDEIQAHEVEEVCQNKAIQAFNKIGKPVLVEDTGFYLEEFNGFPGALIKLFNEKVSSLEICHLISKNRNAIAKTCICFYNGKDLQTFVGEVEGKIAKEPKGSNGWGFDDFFIPNGYDKTYAEFTDEEKNKISMRKIALNKFKEKLL